MHDKKVKGFFVIGLVCFGLYLLSVGLDNPQQDLKARFLQMQRRVPITFPVPSGGLITLKDVTLESNTINLDVEVVGNIESIDNDSSSEVPSFCEDKDMKFFLKRDMKINMYLTVPPYPQTFAYFFDRQNCNY